MRSRAAAWGSAAGDAGIELRDSGEREPYNTVKIPQPPRFRGPSIRNFTRFCYRALAGAGLLLVVLFAAGVLWLRYVTLPNVESWRPQLIASIESASGMAVEVRRLEGGWFHVEM